MARKTAGRKLISVAAFGIALGSLAPGNELINVQGTPFYPEESPSVRYAVPFRGVDMGAQINGLYNSLPANGGAIVVKGSATFATPIVFATKDKPVLLIGLPGDIVTLTYTGVGGVAVT